MESTDRGEEGRLHDGWRKALAQIAGDIVSDRYSPTMILILSGPVMLLAAALPGNFDGTTILDKLVRGAGFAIPMFVAYCNIALFEYLRAISAHIDSKHRRPTAICFAMGMFVSMICSYASIYLMVLPDRLQADLTLPWFEAALERGINAFYFSTITITTLGYGDVAPVGVWARLAAAVEAINGLVMFGIFTGALTAFIAAERGESTSDQKLRSDAEQREKGSP